MSVLCCLSWGTPGLVEMSYNQIDHIYVIFRHDIQNWAISPLKFPLKTKMAGNKLIVYGSINFFKHCLLKEKVVNSSSQVSVPVWSYRGSHRSYSKSTLASEVRLHIWQGKCIDTFSTLSFHKLTGALIAAKCNWSQHHMWELFLL